MSILQTVSRSLVPRRTLMRANDAPLAFDEWTSMFNFGAMQFPFMSYGTTGMKEEEISSSFAGLVQGAYASNGIVFACEMARIMLFSEARFQWRRRESGRPGELFGTNELAILEHPSPGRTTGDLLTRALLHADFGGTGFVVRRSANRIRQPRPDWMTIILGSEDDPDVTGDDLDADVIGYLYHPGGYYSGQRPIVLLPEELAVFAPIPDPLGHFRGMPWMTPILREIMADSAATSHKLKFFENGATPQMIVSLDLKLNDPKKLREWIEVIEQDHKGSTNAYKTLYLAAGAKADVVGKDLQQLDFKATQGAGETRIAAAAQCGAIVAMLSEGLQGSSLNAGNYGQAMRRFADLFARPNWRNMAGSLENIVTPPPGAELWYDDRDIPALKDDVKDAADVQSVQATAIRTLSDGGFRPDSVVDSIIAGDWKRLVHTGKLSVQLQTPGAAPASPDGTAALVSGSSAVALLGAGEVRCPSCDKLVARTLGPGTDFDCPRCHAAITA